ncbi:hypothetical protein GDO78_005546 [Eleutherodactylus coqui]|uniref:Uncharacterized protein n=1 Tax=Eleutherodactylus coqui TaxID=57060 RepID=A0A8J6KFF0_ELECQ|nr:hypothetical protein GDO78_005546 [Eleutherodactylus coqui]
MGVKRCQSYWTTGWTTCYIQDFLVYKNIKEPLTDYCVEVLIFVRDYSSRGTKANSQRSWFTFYMYIFYSDSLFTCYYIYIFFFLFQRGWIIFG